MTKCYLCKKGILVKKKIPYSLYGILVGEFEGEQCTNCKESFYDEKVFDQMTQKVKKLGLWGLETKTRLTKVGNSYDIRLSKKIIDFMEMKKGEEVTIIPEGKKKLTVFIE